eukprot:17687-Amphidinium_carterae.1
MDDDVVTSSGCWIVVAFVAVDVRRQNLKVDVDSNLVALPEESFAMVAREVQLISHENPKVLQAGELILLASVRLLRMPSKQCSREERRTALLDALHGAADIAGPQYHAVLEGILSEAQSRESIQAAMAKASSEQKQALKRVLGTRHNDMAVISRLTASGADPGREAQAGQASYLMPAVLWLAVAYETLPQAAVANARLGGESSMRAIFIGVLLAARDGANAVPSEAASRARTVLPLSLIHI